MGAKRKIFSFLLCMIVLCSLLPLDVFSQGTQNLWDELPHSDSDSGEITISSDELFAKVTNSPALLMAAGEYYGDQLTGDAKTAYEIIKTHFDDIDKNGTGLSKISTTQLTGSNGASALMNAFYAFMRDHTESIYWVGKGYNEAYQPYMFSAAYNSSEVNFYIPVITMYQGDSFVDSGKYTYYQLNFQNDSAERERALEKADEIVTYAQQHFLTDYQKVRYFNQEICNLTYYDNRAANAPYGDTYQMYYVFNEQPVVCEGYAKAFKYLCDQSNIGCLIIEGSIGSVAHMWNYVQLDGKWYIVDVTNNDGRSDLSTMPETDKNTQGLFHELLLAIGSDNVLNTQLNLVPNRQNLPAEANDATVNQEDYQPKAIVSVESSGPKQVVLNIEMENPSMAIPTLTQNQITLSPDPQLAISSFKQESGKITIDFQDNLPANTYQINVLDPNQGYVTNFAQFTVKNTQTVQVMVDSFTSQQVVLQLKLADPSGQLPTLQQSDITITPNPNVAISGFRQEGDKVTITFAGRLAAGVYQIGVKSGNNYVYETDKANITIAKPQTVQVMVDSFTSQQVVLQLKLADPSGQLPTLHQSDITITPDPNVAISGFRQEGDKVTITFAGRLAAGSYAFDIHGGENYDYVTDATQIVVAGKEQYLAPTIFVTYDADRTSAEVSIFNPNGDGTIVYSINKGREIVYTAPFTVDTNALDPYLTKEISAYIRSSNTDFQSSEKTVRLVELSAAPDAFSITITAVTGLKGTLSKGTVVASLTAKNIPNHLTQVVYQIENGSEGNFKVYQDKIIVNGEVGPGTYTVFVSARPVNDGKAGKTNTIAYAQAVIVIESAGSESVSGPSSGQGITGSINGSINSSEVDTVMMTTVSPKENPKTGGVLYGSWHYMVFPIRSLFCVN